MTPKHPRLPDDARSAPSDSSSGALGGPGQRPVQTGSKPAPRSAMPRTSQRGSRRSSPEVFDMETAPADFDRPVRQPWDPMSKDGLPPGEGPSYRGWPVPMRGVWEAMGPLMLMGVLTAVPVALLGAFGSLGSLSRGAALGLAGINFAAGLGGHVLFSLPASGHMPASSGTFTWLPLMGALILLRSAYSAGMRLWHSARRETDFAVSSLAYALLMGAAGGVTAVISRQSFAGADPATSALVPTGWSLLGLLVGGVTAAGGPLKFARVQSWLASKGQWWKWGADYLSALFRSAGIILLALLALGALLVGGSLLWHWSDFIAASEGVSGSISSFAAVAWAQAAYVPNLLVFAVAWATGAGVSFGVGTLASPVGTTLGALPPLPLLTILPHEVPAWGWLVLVLPVLCAGVGAWWFYREGEDHLLEYLELRMGPTFTARLLAVLLNALLLALLVSSALVVCSWCAGGSLGLGRFTQIGAEAFSLWWMSALEVFLGTAIGLLLAPAAERD